MSEWIAETINLIFPGLVIAVFTSILTVHLAIRRFHKEKWWEKKQEFYSKLLDAIHHLKNYAAEHYEDQIIHDHLNDEKRAELTADWKKFSREFSRLSDLASFHLSKKAVEILSKYQKDKEAARNNEDLFAWIESDLIAATKCLDALKIEAKRDLKIK